MSVSRMEHTFLCLATAPGEQRNPYLLLPVPQDGFLQAGQTYKLTLEAVVPEDVCVPDLYTQERTS